MGCMKYGKMEKRTRPSIGIEERQEPVQGIVGVEEKEEEEEIIQDVAQKQSKDRIDKEIGVTVDFVVTSQRARTIIF